jgi:hypothetical protein
MIAEIVAAAHQWADVQTFDLQTVHTLGILSSGHIILNDANDLVGSATSSINMNAFDVDENGVATLGTSLDIAGTIAIVGTIDDDTMGTATDTTIATSESIATYADGTPIAQMTPSTAITSITESVTEANGRITKTGLIAHTGDSSKAISFATPFTVGCVPKIQLTPRVSASDANLALQMVGAADKDGFTAVAPGANNMTHIGWTAVGY